MGTLMDKTPGDLTDPIQRLRGGDRQALATLFEQHRERLRLMVTLRLDPRLRARLDASDVVQEAFLDVARGEAAQLLGIMQESGAKRYFRALKRLKDALATMPGGLEGL
jgi:DNA-directed RNA polymerase specialized sigma24 family protein